MSQEPPEQVFTAGDLVQIRGRGIEIKEAIRQITLLRNPPGYLSLDRPCTVNDGITSIPPDGMQGLTALHGSAAREARVLRFVPASGAASRMFRDLLYYQRQGRELWPDDVKAELRLGRREAGALRAFLKKIRRFAFAADLERVLAASGASLDEHAASGPFKPILDALLSRDAMGYGDLPKGLLKFHAYADEIRTPLEEHLVEAAKDSRDARGICRLHLTVSAEHLDRFR